MSHESRLARLERLWRPAPPATSAEPEPPEPDPAEVERLRAELWGLLGDDGRARFGEEDAAAVAYRLAKWPGSLTPADVAAAEALAAGAGQAVGPEPGRRPDDYQAVQPPPREQD